MLEFTAPVFHHGCAFDRGMILYEFSALREPEATRFPQIGAWVRERCPMVEIPTPSMLWRGAIVPDLFIANQISELPADIRFPIAVEQAQMPKDVWADDVPLEVVSTWQQGTDFHDAFIEPMCRKITGLSTAHIVAKYHRAIWLPLYWPQTLRARQSIRTPFWYPAAGYAGAVSAGIASEVAMPSGRLNGDNQETAEIRIAYILAKPRRGFSVCFAVDESPIYRITDMDACAGIECAEHRLVVEYRGECNIALELERLILAHYPQQVAYDYVRLTLPTLANVAAGWTPRPNMNDQLWEHINAEVKP